MKITVQQVSDKRFVASYGGIHSSACGTGSTASQAVGDLVYHHPSIMGLEFTEEDLRTPKLREAMKP